MLSGAFFCCWAPYVGLNTWLANSTRDTEVPYLPDLIVTLLAFFNSAVNPFEFILLTRDLRAAVRLFLARNTRCPCFIETQMDISTVQAPRSASQVNLYSNGENYRFMSRGSCDSGVELDLNRFRENPANRLSQCPQLTNVRSSFCLEMAAKTFPRSTSKSSSGDCIATSDAKGKVIGGASTSSGLQNTQSTASFKRQFLGDELAVHMSLMDQASRCSTPEEVKITVPSLNSWNSRKEL